MFERVPKDNWHWTKTRSSRSNFFFKIGVLQDFVILTGIHLCWSLFSIKTQAWRAATLLKRDSNTGVSCKCCAVFKKSFFMEDLRWLFLQKPDNFHRGVSKNPVKHLWWSFCRNIENMSTVFTKNPISDVWRVPKHVSASKRFLKLIYNIRPVEMKKNLGGWAFIKNFWSTWFG